MTYHVVCHDCRFERVRVDSLKAVTDIKWHREETEHEHNVEYKKVD